MAGLLLATTVLFFFLRDGAQLWGWLVGLAPAARREDVDEIGRRGWTTLGRYLRGVSIVALVDAVLIGIALAIIGVPLVLPLVILTFVAAFIPLVGAVVAGGLAVLVALVSQGPLAAVIVVAVTTGTVVAGIAGVLLAIPVAAVVWTGVSYGRAATRRPAANPAPARSWRRSARSAGGNGHRREEREHRVVSRMPWTKT